MSETEASEPQQPYKKFRMGSYVGEDLQVTFHMLGLGQVCKNLAMTHVDSEGNASISSLLVLNDVDIREPGKWEVKNDEDSSSAACIFYLDLDKFPAQQLESFAKLANALTIEVWAESSTVRIEHSYKNGKAVYAHSKPVRWWSSETGYKDVPYAEFVRIHGEADY